MNVVEIESVCKTYKNEKQPALKDVSLKIEKGTLTTIIGRNASGKTTLLKCIAGLIDIDAGKILIRPDTIPEPVAIDKNNNGIPPERRKKIGFIFQNMALWPHWTILDNVAHPLIDIHGWDKETAIKFAQEWLVDKLKIKEKKLDKFPGELSVGTQRRVAIARTFATNPDLLLIDEIEANLDPEAVEIVMSILREEFIIPPLKTVIMITQRMDFMSSYGSRVVVLDEGKIIENSNWDEIFKKIKSDQKDTVKEIMEPSLSPWNFAFMCLESSIKIISGSVDEKDSPINVFQRLSSEVLKLLKNLDPESNHLVLIAEYDFEKSKDILLRGASKSESFLLDGRDAESLGSIIEKSTMLEGCDSKLVYVFKENYEKLICDKRIVSFKKKDKDESGGIVSTILIQKTNYSYLYAETCQEIIGLAHFSIPFSKKDSLEANAYYEFSKKTKNVYCFSMQCNKDVVGMMSIDTYSEAKWLPFVVKQLKLIADLGATAIKYRKKQ